MRFCNMLSVARRRQSQHALRVRAATDPLSVLARAAIRIILAFGKPANHFAQSVAKWEGGRKKGLVRGVGGHGITQQDGHAEASSPLKLQAVKSGTQPVVSPPR